MCLKVYDMNMCPMMIFWLNLHILFRIIFYLIINEYVYILITVSPGSRSIIVHFKGEHTFNVRKTACQQLFVDNLHQKEMGK